MYADITDIADITRLQASLDRMVQLAETWQLKLSIDKCCVLHSGQQQTTSSSVLSSLHSYTICGHQLPVVTHCRDLGVIIANTCQPCLHINTIDAKARQCTNVMLHCFQNRDRYVLLRAFKVCVRPILEYNTIIWSTSQKKDVEAHRKSTTLVYEETLWTQRLFIFGMALEVKHSKLRTTKDTLWSYSDLSNWFWPLSVDMSRIFPIKWAQYDMRSSV